VPTPDDRALFTDLYELTMTEAHLAAGHDPRVTFDLHFRTLPSNRGYVVAAGLEQVVEYVESLSFDDETLAYLDERGFSAALRDHLAAFSFSGEIRAPPEGTVVFPNEPLLEVTAPVTEAQLFETYAINQIGYQSLVATKAARMRDAVATGGDGQTLVDFGSRRAHGTDAGLKAARAAYVGGFDGTSNVAAGRAYDLPTFGTMAHSWVQSFESERAAFAAFVDVYGDESVLLVDTYDTLGGVRTAREVAAARGVDLAGVRLDSGDLVALSKDVDRLLDGAEVFVSSGIDEYAIAEFLAEGGVATGFGPGTALVTSSDAPTLDAVYKLVAVERGGALRPSTKLSPGKPVYPGQKSVRRVERDGEFRRDVLARRDESGPGAELLVPVVEDGRRVRDPPSLAAVRDRAREQVASLPADVRALRDPGPYPVTVSADLDATARATRAALAARYRPGE
jgi:nicotinate phosphoribosyltransferase